MAFIIIGVATALAIASLAFCVNRQVACRRRAEAVDSFFNISPDPFLISTFAQRTLGLNPGLAAAFDYAPFHFGSAPGPTVVHSDDCGRAAALPRRKPIFAHARDERSKKHNDDEMLALNESLEAIVVARTRAAEDRARDAERDARDARRTEEQLRIFVENTPAAVAMLDRDLRYLVASRQWNEDYALGPEPLVGRRHYDVFPEVEPRWRDIHQRCLQGATERCEEDAFPRRDGTIDWVRWEIHPWHTAEGDIGGIIILTEVVTRRRLAAQELRDTTAELTRINSELETFTYSVSHDLKEPLRTLESFSQFLLEDYGDKLGAEGKDHLTRLTRAAARMKHHIEGLLTISRVARQVGEEATPIVVERVIADVVEGMRVMVHECHATVVVAPGLPDVLADPLRIEQIFGNLVANGIKFNKSGAPRIDVGACETDAGEIVFSVRDNGIGIDAEYHEKIFEVFQRLHCREEFEGTGAGLAIVKRAVEALGGRVWVESILGEGTTFHLTLPVSPARAERTIIPDAA